MDAHVCGGSVEGFFITITLITGKCMIIVSAYGYDPTVPVIITEEEVDGV